MQEHSHFVIFLYCSLAQSIKRGTMMTKRLSVSPSTIVLLQQNCTKRKMT